MSIVPQPADGENTSLSTSKNICIGSHHHLISMKLCHHRLVTTWFFALGYACEVWMSNDFVRSPDFTFYPDPICLSTISVVPCIRITFCLPTFLTKKYAHTYCSSLKQSTRQLFGTKDRHGSRTRRDDCA